MMNNADRQRIIDVFKRLATLCLELNHFWAARDFCQFLTVLQSGQWNQLDQAGRLFILAQLEGVLHFRTLGEVWPREYEAEYSLARTIVREMQECERKAI